MFLWTVLLAADAVARVAKPPGLTLFTCIHTILAVYPEWAAEVERILDSSLNGERLLPREAQVSGLWLFFRANYGLKRDWRQFFRETSKVHSIFAWPDDRSDRIQTLAVFRSSESRSGSVFVARDGRVLLGGRQLKQGIAKAFGVSVPRTSRRVETLATNVGDGRPLDPAAPDEWEGVDEALDAAGAVDVVRTWAAFRLRDANPGAIRRAVLENFEALLSGRVSVRSLAKRVGLSRAALQRTLNEEKQSLETFRKMKAG